MERPISVLLDNLFTTRRYSDFQKTLARSQIVNIRGAVLTELTEEANFNAWFEQRIGVQPSNASTLLFIDFGKNVGSGSDLSLAEVAKERRVVNEIASSFTEIRTMLTTALQHVGKFNTFSSTPYEICFGKHASRSNVSWAHRSAKVTDILTEIDASLDKKWVIQKAVGNDVASWSAGDKLAIGTGWTGAGKFSAGVIIHELGHSIGLADVCDLCPYFNHVHETEHFHDYTKVEIKCGKNSDHGKLTGGKGHFIGLKRVKLLAKNKKNLTVWNTDSYRWFCYHFFKADVDRSLGRPIVW